MKGEITKYNSLVKSIKPLAQRLDAKGNDTFTLLGFWRASEGEVPAFSYVLRAVLSNAPNSIPPERVFSILNNTFDDDQDSAHADYIELALQLQFTVGAVTLWGCGAVCGAVPVVRGSVWGCRPATVDNILNVAASSGLATIAIY